MDYQQVCYNNNVHDYILHDIYYVVPVLFYHFKMLYVYSICLTILYHCKLINMQYVFNNESHNILNTISSIYLLAYV